ncbi:hypothetical protein [Pseudidiomarina sp.]|uniref:hypothetical protein n=1 Tax=Pseudidiomarina sp. TaxID=2081707 RepID=UPI003A97E45F
MNWLSEITEYHGVLSAVAALMSAVAAFILLRLGYKQHEWNQTHNKALVKPFLTGMLSGDPRVLMSFSIVNKGLGTALVDKLEANFEGVPKKMIELEEKLREMLPSYDVSVGEFSNQYGFSPNDSFGLVNVKVKSTCRKSPSELLQEFQNVLKSVSVHVTYHSMLDDTELSYESKNDLSILERVSL